MSFSAIDARIHQEVDFAADPARIYEALLSHDQFSAFTGAAAQIQREAGGPFSLFGGRVIGRTVELIPDRRIVQAWRVEQWPAGVYAIVRFELIPNGMGTRLVLDETGFPIEQGDAHDGNWANMYWGPMRAYLDA
jgi:activator of HSP90 ATPase